MAQNLPNTACTRLVGLLLRSVRVFRQFARLEVDSGKVSLSRPAHQRVTRAVRRFKNYGEMLLQKTWQRLIVVVTVITIVQVACG